MWDCERCDYSHELEVKWFRRPIWVFFAISQLMEFNGEWREVGEDQRFRLSRVPTFACGFGELPVSVGVQGPSGEPR
jgi:hypothetical protein